MKSFILFFLTIYSLLTITCDATVIFVEPFSFESLTEEDFFIDDSYEEKDLLESLFAKKTDEEIVLEKAPNLDAKLKALIYGQDHAVKETTEAIIRFAAGVNDPNSPIASLFYSGPSGVGKTELAKQLCLELYGTLTRLIRINMSEYSEPHSLSRLIGSPPGYVGYGDGGQLTNALLKNPYSIILLDEVEKAHPKVLKLFLQALDEGFITTATGKVVDCRKSIFLLTSNLAASEIADLHTKGLDHEEIAEILKPFYMEELSPELFNRIDLVLFSPLSAKVLEALINKMLKNLEERVNLSKKIKLRFDRTIIEYFMDFCLDPKLGARPLKRLIDKELATVLARAIIQGKCAKGDTIKCSYKGGLIVVEKV